MTAQAAVDDCEYEGASCMRVRCESQQVRQTM